MASGINNTFRQVAIATAVATLGTIFAHGLAHATRTTLRSDYASTLNELLLISACLAFAAGLLAMMLIRQRDFVGQRSGAESPQPSGEPQPA